MQTTLDKHEYMKFNNSRLEAQKIVQSIFSDTEITSYDKKGTRPKIATMKISEWNDQADHSTQLNEPSYSQTITISSENTRDGEESGSALNHWDLVFSELPGGRRELENVFLEVSWELLTLDQNLFFLFPTTQPRRLKLFI